MIVTLKSQGICDLSGAIQISLTIDCVGEPFMGNAILSFSALHMEMENLWISRN